MSRIAGIVSHPNAAPIATWVNRMIGLERVGRWSVATECSGRAAMAWTGWRQVGIAHAEDWLVAFDGRLYNRSDFAQAASDAEIVLALCRRYGVDEALRRLNGDFALAAYERERGTLSLARDRFGIKPLYYARTPAAVAFASRPRALFGVPNVSRDLHRQFVAVFAASHYRYFDNQPDRSPYEHVRQVPAGHVVHLGDGQERSSRYWTLEPLPDFSAPEAALAEEYQALLVDSVRRRLAVAEHPAFTLSGGMDSSSVLASAVHVLGGKQHAYSVVYDDKAYDESAEIETMLDATVKEWHALPIGTPDVPTIVDRMIELHDEPVATATWLSHHLLCERVHDEGFGALFGGLGGDELNAGEYEYFFFFFADLAAAGRDAELAGETAKWVEYHDHPIFQKSEVVMRDGLERLVDLGHAGVNRPDRRRLERYRGVLDPGYFDLGAFEPVMDRPFPSYLKNRTYQDLFRETAPCCLRAEDRQSTAAGLDHFLPFLDHRLVEFMFRVPGVLKFRAGVTKHLLRLAMRGLLPEDTRTRIKKTGWNAPAHVWFCGAGANALRDLVRSRVFRERGIYRPDAVMTIIDEHEAIVQSGRLVENHMMFLWQLLNLELWLRQVDAARG